MHRQTAKLHKRYNVTQVVYFNYAGYIKIDHKMKFLENINVKMERVCSLQW